MKQGGGTIDTNALASGRGLSSGSPSVAPVWSSPTTVKTSVGTTGSYIPSYTSWYPTTHQESMQQSQLMWTETSALDSAMARESGWWRGIQPLNDAQHNAQHQSRSLLLHAESWHSGLLIPDDGKQWRRNTRRRRDWETEKARNAPEGNKSVTVSGRCRQMDPFLAAVYQSVQFLFFNF